ncbi:hypothetical protein Tco_0546495 [Tanacetum coccineum]
MLDCWSLPPKETAGLYLLRRLLALTLPPEETCCSLPLEETGFSLPPEETGCSLPLEETCYSLPPEETPLLIEARAESPSHSNVPRVIGCLNHADIMPLIRGTTFGTRLWECHLAMRMPTNFDQRFLGGSIRGSLDRRVPPEGFHCFDRREVLLSRLEGFRCTRPEVSLSRSEGGLVRSELRSIDLNKSCIVFVARPVVARPKLDVVARPELARPELAVVARSELARPELVVGARPEVFSRSLFRRLVSYRDTLRSRSEKHAKAPFGGEEVDVLLTVAPIEAPHSCSKGVSEGKDATTNKLNEDADPNRRFLDDGFDDDDSPN